MEKIKKLSKKNKRIIFIITILVLTIICLVVYIFTNNKDTTVSYSQLKINNNLDDATACKTNKFKTDKASITIDFCGDKVKIYDTSNTITVSNDANTDTTDTSTCTKDVVEEKYLNVSNVIDLYISYNYTEDSYIYYILTSDGKVYTTNRESIINKNYDVTLISDLSNIVKIDEYVTYKNDSNAYTYDIYAIDNKGKLHFLRNSH